MRLLAGLTLGLAGCSGRQARTADLPEADRAAIADTIRAESERMLEVMRTRQGDSVLAFYGRRAAYVGNGVIGDWAAILAAAPSRYASYTSVECRWEGPLRIDVLSRAVGVVTGVLTCAKADTAGRQWTEVVARTEVLAPEAGRWRIVAVHESTPPGTSELR